MKSRKSIKKIINIFKILFFCACIPAIISCGLLAKDSDIGAKAADADAQGENAWEGDPVPYKTRIVVSAGETGEKDTAFLKGKMEDLSQLVSLAKEPPDSMLGLERRAIQDQETALKLMHSQCYYDGKAEYVIDGEAKPALVTLTLEPGPVFTVGEAKVTYEPAPVIPESFKNRERVIGFWGLEKEKLPPPNFPDSVPNVAIGKPVVADDMLNAVEAIPKNLQNNGYPLAKVTSSVYTLNKAERKLNAAVVINPGPPSYMGKIIIKGDKAVNPEYLRKLVPWKPGQEPWDAALMESYANRLRGLGLFRSVEVKPATENMKAHDKVAQDMPILVEVQDGPTHTVTANARYDSDTGFGVEGTWESRNLFGNGEKLKIDAPISQQEYGIKTHFEKPAFMDRQQMFYADLAALWENTEAYRQQSVKGDLGLLRQLAPHWWGGVSFYAEGGKLKDGENPEEYYGVVSPRAGLRYDGRNNRFNPSKGMEMDFKLKPFSGFYEEYFGALAGTLMLAGYYAPLGKRPDGKINDDIVLAARAEAGAMPMSSPLRFIPASLRYYTGGAGSVRGYTYQSIGPRNSDGDPLGGRSYQFVNLESRFMVAKNVGIVPFLDGGMVYREEFPKILGDMDWGTGLGFRYYTPIGPVRLDVATPLHRIDGDPPVQFYISIGQSF